MMATRTITPGEIQGHCETIRGKLNLAKVFTDAPTLELFVSVMLGQDASIVAAAVRQLVGRQGAFDNVDFAAAIRAEIDARKPGAQVERPGSRSDSPRVRTREELITARRLMAIGWIGHRCLSRGLALDDLPATLLGAKVIEGRGAGKNLGLVAKVASEVGGVNLKMLDDLMLNETYRRAAITRDGPLRDALRPDELEWLTQRGVSGADPFGD